MQSDRNWPKKTGRITAIVFHVSREQISWRVWDPSGLSKNISHFTWNVLTYYLLPCSQNYSGLMDQPEWQMTEQGNFEIFQQFGVNLWQLELGTFCSEDVSHCSLVKPTFGCYQKAHLLSLLALCLHWHSYDIVVYQDFHRIIFLLA